MVRSGTLEETQTFHEVVIGEEGGTLEQPEAAAEEEEVTGEEAGTLKEAEKYNQAIVNHRWLANPEFLFLSTILLIMINDK